ncbi:MAG TPA: SDR family oxidoreductase [Polyangiaceae bacterium]|nr:SDR family oxidoreductase [Polyangiaceae bacterium]
MATRIFTGSGMLSGKVGVVHGGGGAIGGAVALAFAEEGARVFLAGRTRDRLDEVAERIRALGGEVEVDVVDGLEPAAVEGHAERVIARAGRMDVVLNALGFLHVQGKSFSEQTLDEFATPLIGYTRAHFIIAQAAARFMIRQGSCVILALSTPGSVLPGPGFMGYGVACAALEAMTRHLAGELGAHGVRAICLRADAIPEALARSHSRAVFSEVAARHGLTPEAMLAAHAEHDTLLGRLPTLRQVAQTAAFFASERAGATTAAIVNLTCGSQVD